VARAGQQLGGHVLEALLGRGASGEVWRARHAVTDAPVALKLLDAGGLGAEARLRFQREAQALARIAGEGVVPSSPSSPCCACRTPRRP
jgi:serine/threonine protein kinase